MHWPGLPADQRKEHAIGVDAILCARHLCSYIAWLLDRWFGFRCGAAIVGRRRKCTATLGADHAKDSPTAGNCRRRKQA
jgi:hypothetical protein